MSGHKLPTDKCSLSDWPLVMPRIPTVSIEVVLAVLANGSVIDVTSDSEEFIKLPDDLLPGAYFAKSAAASFVLSDIEISLKSSTDS